MVKIPSNIDRSVCQAMDEADPLRHFRGLFALPADLIYMDGNSLGPTPRTVSAKLAEVADREWAEGLVRSWNTAAWIDAPNRLGEKLRPVLGAEADSVTVCDSLSINLFKVLTAARRLRPDRSEILTDVGNFPSDLYVAQSVADMAGAELRRIPSERVAESLDENTAVLMLTHVDFKTAEIFDMRRLTEAAHQCGALVVWNLAHSAGAVPLDLSGCEVDFAVGCGYKYLNGGPGAPAFVYVAPRWISQTNQPLAGWLGHQDPFAFAPDYAPAEGIGRMLCGTPPILAFAALEAALDVFPREQMEGVRAKSLALSEMLIRLVEERCGDLTLASPRDAAVRGSHVSFAHPHGYALVQALIEAGVIGDFRAPDLARFGITPLYQRFVDIWDAAIQLEQILSSRSWDQPRFHRRATVT